ncbi:LysR family transcriptional regulator [Brucella intermedia]|uniref:LysR family transcriptional regulator n=1 Tax=Brucella intermedia GD04153 TaxID=2975438 RepID=A0AA42H2E2_9HYPH|nr:LysR family transcriptional regulator [Brucella intermedia]KAB2706076.1 LysR family transcriptional regulator [Brucella intermedia]MCO7738380.1 LysR family transcriptional regulator [Brucella intermedia]MDH0126572.1 LysR family transcriptional regulator [Brucella intermedia GD04153]NYD80379.1 DNA-binding transcriptional LysR family regulator [Brucella intermedia]UXO84953.1 LysR family transcriptional regulator [Brucella intermedia]
MPNLLNETAGLLAFVRTVEAGSFSAAARLLKTSPSVVSRSVGRLERLIEARLFLRSTRALVLTADGHLLFERLSPLLRELDIADDEINARKEISGRVRFSMSSELAPLFLDTILSGFAKRYPGIHLEIGLTDRHVDIIREDYDVAFRVGAIENGDLIIRRLADFEMIMVGSPDFANNHGLPGTIKEAARLPFARYMGNGYPNDVKLDDGTHFVPQGRVDCDSGQALKAAARHGLGAAVVMRSVVKDDLEKGTLVEISKMLPLPSMPFHAVHAYKRLVPMRVRVLCDMVESRAKSLASS